MFRDVKLIEVYILFYYVLYVLDIFKVQQLSNVKTHNNNIKIHEMLI